MKLTAFKSAAAFTLAVALGCSEPVGVDSADLTNDEAAKLVAAETEATKAQEVAFNQEGAPTVEFSVPDMMCEDSCVPTVRETLAAQPGVKDVKVDLVEKKATVAVDKEAFDAKAAVAALVDLQFTATKLLEPGAEKAHN